MACDLWLFLSIARMEWQTNFTLESRVRFSDLFLELKLYFAEFFRQTETWTRFHCLHTPPRLFVTHQRLMERQNGSVWYQSKRYKTSSRLCLDFHINSSKPPKRFLYFSAYSIKLDTSRWRAYIRWTIAINHEIRFINFSSSIVFNRFTIDPETSLTISISRIYVCPNMSWHWIKIEVSYHLRLLRFHWFFCLHSRINDKISLSFHEFQFTKLKTFLLQTTVFNCFYRENEMRQKGPREKPEKQQREKENLAWREWKLSLHKT